MEVPSSLGTSQGEGALESEEGGVSLTWGNPLVRKRVQGSAGALRCWIFVLKAVGAMDTFEQGSFRGRVLTKRSLWLLCVGRTGSEPGVEVGEIWRLWQE